MSFVGTVGSSESSAVRGRKLNDENRRRLERQEATALKMRVSEDRIKTAIIAVKWPIPVCMPVPCCSCGNTTPVLW